MTDDPADKLEAIERMIDRIRRDIEYHADELQSAASDAALYIRDAREKLKSDREAGELPAWVETLAADWEEPVPDNPAGDALQHAWDKGYRDACIDKAAQLRERARGGERG